MWQAYTRQSVWLQALDGVATICHPSGGKFEGLPRLSAGPSPHV